MVVYSRNVNNLFVFIINAVKIESFGTLTLV